MDNPPNQEIQLSDPDTSNTVDESSIKTPTESQQEIKISKTKPKKVREPKIPFSKECNHCKKTFKTEKTYDHHVNTQVCFSAEERTFCKVCNVTLDTHDNYLKHLLSLDHVNNIGCNKLEVLNENKTPTILSVDPYLNDSEARRIGTTNLGGKFTLVFQDDSHKVVNLVDTHYSTTASPTPPTSTTTTTKTTKLAHEPVENGQDKLSIRPSIRPTARQQKILGFLEGKTVETDARASLLKILDNKLQLEDYQGLQYFIEELQVSENIKKIYLDIVNEFIGMLVKEKTAGKKLYKDKDITKLVILITSR
jgi:hypothetical protein